MALYTHARPPFLRDRDLTTRAGSAQFLRAFCSGRQLWEAKKDLCVGVRLEFKDRLNCNQAVCLTKIVCFVYLNFDEGGTVLSLSLVGKVPRV